MASVIPYIPETITVHLGLPSSSAENVTVSFPDYVKNVASSEIYPTWEPSALRANILCIVSYALNRIYTEYYPSRGYNFNITSTTNYDQKFINGRNIFENISELVDELFNTYIRRQGFIEPLSASFCNGTTVTCPGLSQWGSQSLAKEGFNSVEILKYYYGDNIELVTNVPVQEITVSYPGTALRVGSTGEDVALIQAALNSIGGDYPAIPKIYPVDGIFGPKTEAAVKTFQEIFNLTVDGIVGRVTWYRVLFLYVAVNKLNELQSQGLQYNDIAWEYPSKISPGDSGVKVSHLQYMLSIISEFIDEVSPLSVTGYYDEKTRLAVLAFQKFVGLPQTGVVDEATWDAVYEQFAGIENTTLSPSQSYPPITINFPGYTLVRGMTDGEVNP